MIRKEIDLNTVAFQNEMLEKQSEHRSIREFLPSAIKETDLQQLMEVARRTASSMGLQQSSIIRVRSQEKREALAVIAKQAYVARAPEVWLFIVDNYRNARITQEGAQAVHRYNMDLFFQGFSDAVLMAQNTLTAAEALGLGGVFIGNVLNDPQKIIELFSLPKGTFPALGLLMGYPAQSPQRKPRMDMKLRMFEDEYQTLDNYREALRDYDDVMTQYYDLRDANRRVDSFTQQVDTKLNASQPLREQILRVVREQGFDLCLEEL